MNLHLKIQEEYTFIYLDIWLKGTMDEKSIERGEWEIEIYSPHY